MRDNEPLDLTYSDDSDPDETASLNPERVLQFSIADPEVGINSRKPKGFLARKRKADCAKPEMFNMDGYSIAILAVMTLGIMLLLPGLAMRMKALPTPFPFVALPLRSCGRTEVSEGQHTVAYTLTGLGCQGGGDPGTVSALEVALHEQFLLDSVHYMPRIAFPENLHLSGHLTLELRRDDETVATAAIDFSRFKRDRLYRLGVRGSVVPVYFPPGHPTVNGIKGDDQCLSPEGCLHKLSSTLVEGAIRKGAFAIRPKGDTIMQPIEKLSVVFRNADIRATGHGGRHEAPPEILLSFHQNMLTDKQAKGVKMAIGGVTLVFVGLSLLCFSRAVDREKNKEP